MRKSALVGFGLAMLGLVAVASAQDRTPRTDKVQGVSFHQVSTTPATGFNQVTFNGQSYFVSPKPVISGDQVSSVQAQGASLTLMGNFAGLSKGNQIGVLIDGQMVGVGSAALQNGSATITGLTQEQAQRVTHLLSRKAVSPTGAAFSIVPAGQANGEYVFDVYAQNIPDLRTYQVKLEATGGTAGSLDMTDVRIDETRKDFIFAEEEAIKAADHAGARLGGTLFSTGSVAVVDSPKYLGTWKFRPSADAAGTFKINIVTTGESFVSNSQNQQLPINAVNATVNIGGKARLSD